MGTCVQVLEVVHIGLDVDKVLTVQGVAGVAGME